MILRFVAAGSIALIVTWLARVYLGGPFEEVDGPAFVLVLAAAVTVAALVSTWKVSRLMRMAPAVVAVICGAAMTAMGAYGYAALFLAVFVGSSIGFVVSEVGDRFAVHR